MSDEDSITETMVPDAAQQDELLETKSEDKIKIKHETDKEKVLNNEILKVMRIRVISFWQIIDRQIT